MEFRSRRYSPDGRRIRQAIGIVISGLYTPKKRGFFMDRKTDEKFMRIALNLAQKGEGNTSPNPMVGAVIVKGGRIIGQGYHKRAGLPHAEIEALNDVRGKIQGATMYVNLEPCSHQGRTGPCAPEIIKAGIRRVVYALTDPNPLVAGKGAALLKKAGLSVTGGVLKAEAIRLNEKYLIFIRSGRPFVTLKLAQTLDGRIATKSGDSQWITCPESRKLGHKLRATHDAVVVGAQTIRADNPQLTVRLVKGKNPYRIVVTSRFNISRTCRIFEENEDSRTIVVVPEGGEIKANYKNPIIWYIKKTKDGISLADFLKKAGEFGISSLLVEGGSRLATELLKEGLVDKVYIFTAAKMIGRGIESIGDLGTKKIGQAVAFRDGAFETIGSDVLFTGYPAG